VQSFSGVSKRLWKFILLGPCLVDVPLNVAKLSIGNSDLRKRLQLHPEIALLNLWKEQHVCKNAISGRLPQYCI
jgi:hypothetical protein